MQTQDFETLKMFRHWNVFNYKLHKNWGPSTALWKNRHCEIHITLKHKTVTPKKLMKLWQDPWFLKPAIHHTHTFWGYYRVRILLYKNNFQDFCRTQIDFSRALTFTLTPTIPISQWYSNSPYCLSYTSYFFFQFNRFPELSGTSRVLENARIKLSRFSRTCMSPVILKKLLGWISSQV